MANLVSPGVQVQVIDESFYASSGPGTVPFIMMATAANKPTPGSAATIASGTIPANKGKLYLVTSQRELLQTFGNPKFYTQAGTPQHGNELNEYGLYAAYQYLGIANRAWVMNAPIDLASLAPTTIAPTGSANNLDYWLDLNNTSFGLFRSSGNVNSSLAWGALKPLVLSSKSQLERQVQGVKATPVIDPNVAVITAGGPLAICGIDVTLTSNMTLNQVVNAINTKTTLTKKGVRAEVFSRVEIVTGTPNTVHTVYNLRLVGTDIDTNIDFYRDPVVAAQILLDLGLSSPPINYIVPASSIGVLGDIAVNAVEFLPSGLPQTTPKIGVQMFEKIAVKTDDGTSLRWFKIGTTETNTTGWSWTSSTPTIVTGTVSGPAFTLNDTAIITIGTSKHTFTVLHTSLSGTVTDLNAFFKTYATNAFATVTTSGINSYLTITNYDGTDIGIVDKNGHPFENAGFSVGQTFYGSVTGTTANPTFVENEGFNIKTGSTTGTIIVPASPSLDTVISTINNNADIKSLISADKITVGSNNYLKITSKNNTYFTITNVAGTFSTDTNTPIGVAGVPTGVTFGRKLVYQGYSLSNPQPSTVDVVAVNNIWINTQPSNIGASYSVKVYNSGTEKWVAKQAPLYTDDVTASNAYGNNITTGSVYVQYDPGQTYTNGLPTTNTQATIVIKIWNGNTWVDAQDYKTQLYVYTQSFTTPVGAPTDGIYWYNTNIQVDIMVNQFENTSTNKATAWVGYRVAFPLTDPNGPILSGTAPSNQSNGSSPLVDSDLWIDTSDLENYPKIYRYDGVLEQWNLIDNTDQTSSNGIVFGDARFNVDGTASGSTSMIDMLLNSHVDTDAPSSLSYPVGMLLFNTRYSTYNVKQWKPNYLPKTTDNPTRDRWVTVSGLKNDGSPYMGRHAQRNLVVQSMASVLVSNQDIRSDTNFYNLIASPGYPELASDMINLNVDNKNNAFIVVDAPARLLPDGTSIQNWATDAYNVATDGEQGLLSSSPYAGVYYPWGLATNVDGSNIFVPPSMTVLRTIAFNDQVAYPWFAPAGFTRGLVSAISSVGYLSSEGEYMPVTLSQGQRDVLYINKINPIAYIPGRGLVVYGQKTLNPISSALDRINVARLINYLNYNLDNLAKPFLFEPNDQFTRASVVRTFDTFLADLISLRGLYDFSVVCDESNNTPGRIDRNELWIDIAIKPVKAIEFIYIPLRILNTGDPMPTTQ